MDLLAPLSRGVVLGNFGQHSQGPLEIKCTLIIRLFTIYSVDVLVMWIGKDMDHINFSFARELALTHCEIIL